MQVQQHIACSSHPTARFAAFHKHLRYVAFVCSVPIAIAGHSMSHNPARSPDVLEHFSRRFLKAGASSEQPNAAAPQDCLLLWQISQLEYACGNVHIDLSELIDTVNCLYSFICDCGQAAVKDALVDEAGEVTTYLWSLIALQALCSLWSTIRHKAPRVSVQELQ